MFDFCLLHPAKHAAFCVLFCLFCYIQKSYSVQYGKPSVWMYKWKQSGETERADFLPHHPPLSEIYITQNQVKQAGKGILI